MTIIIIILLAISFYCRYRHYKLLAVSDAVARIYAKETNSKGKKFSEDFSVTPKNFFSVVCRYFEPTLFYFDVGVGELISNLSAKKRLSGNSIFSRLSHLIVPKGFLKISYISLGLVILYFSVIIMSSFISNGMVIDVGRKSSMGSNIEKVSMQGYHPIVKTCVIITHVLALFIGGLVFFAIHGFVSYVLFGIFARSLKREVLECKRNLKNIPRDKLRFQVRSDYVFGDSNPDIHFVYSILEETPYEDMPYQLRKEIGYTYYDATYIINKQVLQLIYSLLYKRTQNKRKLTVGNMIDFIEQDKNLEDNKILKKYNEEDNDESH